MILILSQFCCLEVTPLLMADRLEKLEYAIRLGRRSGRIVKQNIIFALSFIVILLIANYQLI